MKYTMIHEYGHALGLAHDAKDLSYIMHSPAPNVPCMQLVDLNRLRNRYGACE